MFPRGSFCILRSVAFVIVFAIGETAQGSPNIPKDPPSRESAKRLVTRVNDYLTSCSLDNFFLVSVQEGHGPSGWIDLPNEEKDEARRVGEEYLKKALDGALDCDELGSLTAVSHVLGREMPREEVRGVFVRVLSSQKKMDELQYAFLTDNTDPVISAAAATFQGEVLGLSRAERALFLARKWPTWTSASDRRYHSTKDLAPVKAWIEEAVAVTAQLPGSSYGRNEKVKAAAAEALIQTGKSPAERAIMFVQSVKWVASDEGFRVPLVAELVAEIDPQTSTEVKGDLKKFAALETKENQGKNPKVTLGEFLREENLRRQKVDPRAAPSNEQ